MYDFSTKVLKLFLFSPINFQKKRKRIILKPTQKNLIRNLFDKNNISNEDDSIPSFFTEKKIFPKNQRFSVLHQKYAFKNNTFQYNDFSLKSNGEDNYNSEKRDSISNLLNIQNLNKLYGNNNLYSKQQDFQRTEIILKKVRVHDFIERKMNTNRSNVNKKIKIKKIENKNRYNKFNYYLPVQNILFRKNTNNHFSQKNSKDKKIIVGNFNSTRNKALKININNKKIKLKSILPLLGTKESQTTIFNKKNINKKILFNNPERNIKTKLKKQIYLSTNIYGYKKLTNFNFISTPGSNYGKITKNQDSYFIIPKINNCEEIKIFGIFDGHGEKGDILSQEIKEYFKIFFNNLFNDYPKKESKDSLKNNYNIKSINTKQDFASNYNYYSNEEDNLNYSEEIKIQNLPNKLNEKSDKIKYVYNILTFNEYSEIFYSHKKLDESLHTKYSNLDLCILSGSTSLILFLINSKNVNKIIISNLGDSKIILITEKNSIKELNTLHNLNNQGEKKRIIQHGGVINRLNVGPLRIWFKNKNYPGLSITRSFGDFESDSLGVISIPDIKEYDLDEEQIKILIIGTDSLFKFMSNDQIMSIALPYYEQDDVEGATQKIKDIAIHLWNVKNPNGIADITIFVLFFK